MRIIVKILLIGLVGFYINNSSIVFALGEYDGIWIGNENISFAGQYVSETTGSIFYQEDNDTIYMWDSFFDNTTLVKSGNNWILPSPLVTTLLGITISIDSMSVTFHNASYFTGSINFSAQGMSGVANLSHYKQSCQTLSNGVALSNLSGGVGNFSCFKIELPAGADNLNVQTYGGSGDCDIFLGHYKPDFNVLLSEDWANDEELTVMSPSAGTWYVLLVGFEAYSGLTLIANYDINDIDGDGIPDLSDACPNDADNDADVDGVCGDVDNCPNDANNDQADTDNDTVGNVCDLCPGYNDILDADVDEIPDCIDDDDTDGDGFTDAEEVLCGSNPVDSGSKCSRGAPWIMLLVGD